jgi:hypothetical protein
MAADPKSISSALCRIAAGIDASRSPDRRLVAADLRRLIAAVAPGAQAAVTGYGHGEFRELAGADPRFKSYDQECPYWIEGTAGGKSVRVDGVLGATHEIVKDHDESGPSAYAKARSEYPEELGADATFTVDGVEHAPGGLDDALLDLLEQFQGSTAYVDASNALVEEIEAAYEEEFGGGIMEDAADAAAYSKDPAAYYGVPEFGRGRGF